MASSLHRASERFRRANGRRAGVSAPKSQPLQREGPELVSGRAIEAADVIIRLNGSGQCPLVPRPRLVRRHGIAGKALQAVRYVDNQGVSAVGKVRDAVVIGIELQARCRADVQAVWRSGLTRRDEPYPRSAGVPIGEHVVIAQLHRGLGGWGEHCCSRRERGRRDRELHRLHGRPFVHSLRWLVIKPPGRRFGLASVDYDGVLVFGDGPGRQLLVADALQLRQCFVEAGAQRLARRECRGQVLIP